jgi:hypothetical protein
MALDGVVICQSQDVGVLVDVSVNVTVRGASPERGVAVKEATGGGEPNITRGATAPGIHKPVWDDANPTYGCP